jgi:hypothetical protein
LIADKCEESAKLCVGILRAFKSMGNCNEAMEKASMQLLSQIKDIASSHAGEDAEMSILKTQREAAREILADAINKKLERGLPF